MWIKVCGLTTWEDAALATEYGADALGFVFAPGSRRQVDPEVAADIVTRLPPQVTTVGVFQDQPLETVRACMADCGLHVAQLHGREDLAYVWALGRPVIKAVSVGTRADLAVLDAFPGVVPILLDAAQSPSAAGAEGRPAGGVGRTADWGLAAHVARLTCVVLAGGLSPENVAAAVKAVRPWGVDAASGTERSPGCKDPERLRMFIQAALRAGAALDSEDAIAGNPAHAATRGPGGGTGVVSGSGGRRSDGPC